MNDRILFSPPSVLIGLLHFHYDIWVVPVNQCRTNEQNKWLNQELLVQAQCHCLRKEEHMLTIQACMRGVSVICLVESTVDTLTIDSIY